MLKNSERNFYNEETKFQFIEKKESEAILPKNYLITQFSKSYKFENELNKDISNFTTKEIIEYYKILGLSFGSINVLNSCLSQYTQWCIQNNTVKDNQNHFLEITQDVVAQCVNSTLINMQIVSKETIFNWVDAIPNPRDRFILLGLYEGIKGKDYCEFINAKETDVDFANNKLNLCTGRTLDISNKLVDVIKDCITEDKYYSMTGSRCRVTDLEKSNLIVKNYPNANANINSFQKGRRIYNAIQRIFEFLGCPYMTANSVITSGKLNYILENANNRNIKPVDYICSDLIIEVEKQYDFRMVKSTFLNLYGRFLEK